VRVNNIFDLKLVNLNVTIFWLFFLSTQNFGVSITICGWNEPHEQTKTCDDYIWADLMVYTGSKKRVQACF